MNWTVITVDIHSFYFNRYEIEINNKEEVISQNEQKWARLNEQISDEEFSEVVTVKKRTSSFMRDETKRKLFRFINSRFVKPS